MYALQYEGGEPCSICGHVMIPAAARDHDSCMPTTILSGFLYLGSYDTASRQELLKALGITHVLNVSCGQGFLSLDVRATLLIRCCALQTVPTCPALYKNTFTYHTVELAPPEFDECFTFLGKCGEETGVAPPDAAGVAMAVSQRRHASISQQQSLCCPLHAYQPLVNSLG
eukprot:GHRQ01021100.1.p1 GENE.GHRQ01021100.1~~GHRQ01021100.1.p1  ORF type:complete len:171 (-),score=19.53 GHRQ01021100.1:412-924(-)